MSRLKETRKMFNAIPMDEPKMGLYEAVEEIEYYLKYGVDFRPPSMAEREAIRICLEAAKDKGGV